MFERTTGRKLAKEVLLNERDGENMRQKDNKRLSDLLDHAGFSSA